MVVTCEPPQCGELSVTQVPAGEWDAARLRWCELEQQIPHCRLSCTSAWTWAWLDTWADRIPCRILKFSVGNRVVGMCLITEGVDQKDGPVPIRTLHLGTAGEPERDSLCVEYNDLLVLPEYRATVVSALTQVLNSTAGIDQWCLDGVGECDLEEWRQSAGGLCERAERAHWFDLARCRAAGQTVLQALKSAARRKVKRSLESAGPVTVEWANSLDQAGVIFDELVDLHQQRWAAAGKPGAYSSTRFRALHERLLAALVSDGRMTLARVVSHAGTIGCVQLLHERNRVLVYQCGWAVREQVRSPGVVVDYLVMEECLRRGFDAYDFLAFETQHKRLLSTDSAAIVWARHCNRTVRNAVIAAGRSLKSRIQKLRRGAVR